MRLTRAGVWGSLPHGSECGGLAPVLDQGVTRGEREEGQALLGRSTPRRSLDAFARRHGSPGTSHRGHLEENMGAPHIELSADELAMLA
jgi:aryl-alcohol dehydrogenase-like predicted oxidoreductase